MNTKIPTGEVGVLVGRYQTLALHDGHNELIDSVVAKHKKVMILLGNAPTKVTRNNPLDFYTRKLMINSAYPNVVIMPIKDMGSDEEWSKGVDNQIRSVFDIESVVLYGSKDSFAPAYSGKFPVVELEPSWPMLSGTEIRKLASENVRSTEDFRAGAIYAAYNRFPIAYATVDAVLYNEKTDEVLLGRKKTDGDKWRFPGGFVDPKDDSKEEAVARELQEEVGFIAELNTIKYIGSMKVSDWRYKKEVDKVITTIYHIPFTWGQVKVGDDLDEIKWFKLDQIIKNEGYQLVNEHKPFVAKLQTYFKKGK